MVFGYSTNAYVKFTLFEAVKKIGRLGFKGVEIMGDRPHLYPPDFDDAELARLKGLLKDQNLKVTNINSFTLFAVGDTYLPSWIEPEKERREIRIRHTLDSLKIADKLECKNISVPPGGPLNGMSRKEALALFHQGLERVIPLAEELDIKILIEPEPDLMIETSEEFKSFIKDVKSKAVGINFDIGHFYCAGEQPQISFEMLHQWVGHVHLEDIATTRVHRHLIAGLGAISFKAVFQTMLNFGYSGDISLELYPYNDTPDEAGRESLEYLRPIFKESGLDIDV
jgi:sugar phosphate isomerase/epimerase